MKRKEFKTAYAKYRQLHKAWSKRKVYQKHVVSALLRAVNNANVRLDYPKPDCLKRSHADSLVIITNRVANHIKPKLKGI